jgi:hypothetical protein
MLKLGVSLLICAGIPFVLGSGGHAATCDPPGPPPHFGCQWSTEDCGWNCPVCDPFGAPPRAGCSWDLNQCNWICPGYTGVEVTVQTLSPPTSSAHVFVKLSSLCTATGASAICGGSFLVAPGMSVQAKCQALADTVTNSCVAAGYAVTANACSSSGSFTTKNIGCPPTPFALGISNNPNVFDQAGQGPLPDGESESTTGTCSPQPGAPTGLLVDKTGGGSGLWLTWTDAANADHYVVFEDGAPDGGFGTTAGTASNGATGLNIPMPPGVEFYLVAGSNSACGVGVPH